MEFRDRAELMRTEMDSMSNRAWKPACLIAFLFSPLVLPLVGSLAGCADKKKGSDGDLDAGLPDGGSSGDTSAAGDTGDTAAASSLPFIPSNVPLPSLVGLGPVALSSTCLMNTDTGKIGCPGTIDTFPGFTFAQVEQPDGSKAGLFVMRSLSIGAAAQVTVIGALPAVIVATETIDIDGSLSTTAGFGESSAGGFMQGPSGRGAGPGGGDALQGYVAGGGGAYCGRGGKGGVGDASGLSSNGGAPYGSAELSPLLGGSAGGGGTAASLSQSGGQGGGAIQLSAGQRVRVTVAGQINVGGSGGHSNGGGAGSGGALLIEAPIVTIGGTLAANGGGGALFNGGSSGQAGQPGATRAMGSALTAGQGSSASEVDGTDGTATAGSANSAGGGGGGAGRIRINTTSGTATTTGAIISPALTTPCATQGTLKS